MKNILNKIPTFLWVLIIPLLIFGFVGSIIFLFFLLANVEGVASIILLVVGYLIIKPLSNPEYVKQYVPNTTQAIDKILPAIGICFYALMGMAIDQTGNFIYNKPMQYIFCPSESELVRSIDVLHPLPGRTDIIQQFACVDSANTAVDYVSQGEQIIYRFFLYVIICYILILIAKVHYKILTKQKAASLTNN